MMEAATKPEALEPAGDANDVPAAEAEVADTDGAAPTSSNEVDGGESAGTTGSEELGLGWMWNEGPSWAPEWVSWGVLGIAAVVLLLLVVVTIVLIVRRRRAKKTTGARSAGPSVGRRLRSIWRPFYAGIPSRAQHYPTFVVVGATGAGKTHLIGSRVDWRGQVNQFNPSAYSNPLMQLYLGEDAIVHELSAPLLHDVSRATKRALTGLWRNVGPTATFVTVLDARTLATTPDAELRALAQLVRGKMGLMPDSVAGTLDVRVCLSHLDEITGYEEFAAVMGTHERGLDLGSLGQDYRDVQALLDTLDEHLSYALTTRTGEEFARLVRFYDALRGLTGRLAELLRALRGESTDPVHYAPSQLYLASLLPYSYVGDPFTADPDLVVSSIEGYNRRTMYAALALASVGMATTGTMAFWHMHRVDSAEFAVDEHERVQDGQRGSSAEERRLAENAADAIHAVDASAVLWLQWAHVARKHEIAEHFEHSIRESYLLPWLEGGADDGAGADRVTLLYAMSLIYGTRGGALGQHIQGNARWWANSLGLTEQIVVYYIQSSTVTYDAELPATIEEGTGREWGQYSEHLCATLATAEGTVSEEELAQLQAIPSLRSKAEYDALEGARLLLLENDSIAVTLAPILGEFDTALASESHLRLQEVAAAVDELTEAGPTAQAGWGVETLLGELERIDEWRIRHLDVSSVIDRTCETAEGTAAATMARTQASVLIEDVLKSIPDERVRRGLSFFDEDERLPEVGAIRGYGGRTTETISGAYTKDAFEDHVSPVLEDVALQLSKYELDKKDLERVQRFVKKASSAYANAYRDELVTYYLSFEFDPGSRVALPFALKGVVQPSSWFSDFLLTVTDNASLTLVDDEYHAPLASALKPFEPMVALLAEEDGAVPGLEPYAAIVGGVLPLIATQATPAAKADGLDARLSGLGRLSLHTLQGVEVDRRAQVTEWLEGAQIDYIWHAPFDAPLEYVYLYGEDDLEEEIATAWAYDVRPVVLPLLETYPFEPTADVDAQLSEIEKVMRRQGSEAGDLWKRFDRLIGPATDLDSDRVALLGTISAPTGMLAMLNDVQDLSDTLWDADGKRVPLLFEVTPQALPSLEDEGRVASSAHLVAGGSAVYAFNQRPESQSLEMRWWEQGDALVSLTMSTADGGDSEEFTVEGDASTFSFYRLLDLGKTCGSTRGCTRTSTQVGIGNGKRCGRRGVRSNAGTSIAWRIAIDDVHKEHRTVRYTLDSDVWAPFAVRDCR